MVKKNAKDPVERALREKVARAEKVDDLGHTLSWNLVALANHLLRRTHPNVDEALVVSERALSAKRTADSLLVRADALERAERFYEVIPFVEEAIPMVHDLAQIGLRDRIERLRLRAWLATDDATPFVAPPSPKPSPAEDREDREDDNFKLAILNALLHADLIAAVAEVADDEFEKSHAVERAWLSLEPTADQLATITRLFWAGGHAVQHSIYPQWDGEDDTFNIQSITGIERMPNLEVLRIPSSTLDTLLPLARLTKLRTIELGTGWLDHLAPLAGIATLTEVKLGRVEWRIDEPNMRVLRGLVRRGVRVTSHLLE